MSTARTGFRRLRRSSDGRVVAGLCAGVGRELRIDPILLRTTLVLLTLYSGVGLLLYLAGWVLIPMADDSGDSARNQRRNFALAVLMVLLGLIVVPWWGLDWHNISLGLLAVIGLYVLLRREPPGSTAGAEGVGNDAASGAYGVGASASASGPTSPAYSAGAPSGADPASAAGPTTPATNTPPGGWPRRPEPTGEDAVHTMPIPTGWSGSESGQPHQSGHPDQPGQGGQPGQGDSDQDATTPLPTSEDQQETRPVPTSWRNFGPAPASFWEQSDPLGLRDPEEAAFPTVDDFPGIGQHDETQDRTDVLAGAAAYGSGAGDTTALPVEPTDPTVTTATPGGKRRGRFLLPLLTLLGVLGVTGVLGASGEPPVSAYVASSLGVIGLGLLIGTWVGRSVTLIIAGVLTSIALIPTTVSDLVGPTLPTGDGSLRSTPTSVEEIAPSYDLGAGEVRLDLSEVRFADGQEARTAVDVGTGRVLVLLPPNVDVDLSVDVGAGELILLGDQRDGWEHQVETSDYGNDGRGGGNLELSIDGGFGEVEVRRVGR